MLQAKTELLAALAWFGSPGHLTPPDGFEAGPSGIRIRGRKSTPGRYFQVANPGMGWGGTDITDPLSIIESIDPKVARPGLRLLQPGFGQAAEAGLQLYRVCGERGQHVLQAFALARRRQRGMAHVEPALQVA